MFLRVFFVLVTVLHLTLAKDGNERRQPCPKDSVHFNSMYVLKEFFNAMYYYSKGRYDKKVVYKQTYDM